MSDDFDKWEEDDDDWPMHNAYFWYLGIFIIGICAAILVAFVFGQM